MKYSIDFFKELNLPQPVTAGLVNKIVSPKGHREWHENIKQYHYSFNDELAQVYESNEACPVNVEPGLYCVTDVFKFRDNMTWNHYLVVVEDDGTYFAVGEWLFCTNSTWIKEGIKLVKQYFEDPESLEPVKLHKFRIAPKKTSAVRR